jgi:6-phosphofructokinase 1
MRLEQRGVKVTMVDKTIGYELRCAPPIPLDAEYARDLGYAAVTHLLDGGSGAIITIQEGEFIAIPFADVIDIRGVGRRRAVDVTTESYAVARGIHGSHRLRRLRRSGLVAVLAQAGGLDERRFREKFGRFAQPWLDHFKVRVGETLHE